jgi:beta-phosphoglucomutase
MFQSIIFDDETYMGPKPTKAERVAMRRQEINATVDHGIKAIFFDLHGVLVDITGWHRVAFLSALQDFGEKVPIPRSHPVWKVAGGTRKQLDFLALHGWTTYDPRCTSTTQAIYDRKQEYTQEFIKKRCKPIPKIIDVMNYAQSIGLRLACVTNGNRVNAEKMIKASGLYKYFEFIITRDDVGGKVKPSPRPYLEALYKMGLGEKEALVIDDTGNGIMSAVDARCRTWWLKNQDDLSVRNLMRVMHNFRIRI